MAQVCRSMHPIRPSFFAIWKWCGLFLAPQRVPTLAECLEDHNAVRKLHILDTVTFPQLGSSICAHAQKLLVDLAKMSSQKLLKLGFVFPAYLLICRILLFVPHACLRENILI